METLFITAGMMRNINDYKRDYEALLRDSNQLYKELRSGVRLAISKGEDCIITVVDRNIGKTYNIIRAAIEYHLPVVVRNRTVGDIIQKQAEELFDKKIYVINLASRALDGKRFPPVVLKDDDVDLKHIKDKLFGQQVTVCGFSNIYERRG